MGKKTKVTIKSIWGSVLYEHEAEDNDTKQTLTKAGEDRANLRGANLREADLRGADLWEANLRGADLRGANLREADLWEANLWGANLWGANLWGANLREANLWEANLREADLREADLREANLREADLWGANLSHFVQLASRDMVFIFEHLKKELPGLRKALVEGRVDGTQYNGDCACLIGTLGNVDGGVDQVCSMIPFYEKGLHNPGEQWFWNIHEGDTPKNSDFAKYSVQLIDYVTKKRKTMPKWEPKDRRK